MIAFLRSGLVLLVSALLSGQASAVIPTQLAIGFTRFLNYTHVLITDVGRGGGGSPALACFISDPFTAEWYFPDGSVVPLGSVLPADNTIISIRQLPSNAITLHRGNGFTSPTGLYCCGSPTTSVEQRLCIHLVSADCGPLTNPPNGRVVAPSGTLTTTVATYSCNTGYLLTGSKTRVCKANGQWNSTSPTCTFVDCGPLSSPEHGSVDTYTGTVFNSTATYSCLTGYMVSGSETRVCEANGQWSSTQPSCIFVCPPLSSLTNGTITYSDDRRVEGTVATHTCHLLYSFIGDSTRTCQSDGTWTGTSPTCKVSLKFLLHGQTYLNNSVVAITAIGEGDNALLCVTDKSDCCGYPHSNGHFYYPNNTQVPNGFVSKNSLYRNRGQQVVRLHRRNDALSPTGVYRCEVPDSSGVIQNIYITIIVIDCGPLSSPEHGAVDTSAGTIFNSTATYICHAGYVLNGTRTRVCEANGKWNSTQPSCTPVDCGPLVDPVHGSVDTSSGTTLSSIATYSCNMGYKLMGVFIRLCVSDGMWVPGAPHCTIVDCGPLRDPDHGKVNTSPGTTYNSSAIYTCDEGYILNGTASRTCHHNRSWIPVPPVCNPINCGPLSNPENGVVVTTGFSYLERATYTCNTGYRLRGAMTRTCNSSGHWDPAPPSCPPVDCGSLPNPVNGQVDTSAGTTYQKVATYNCSVGHTLTGSMTRTCSANGQWTPRPPVCSIVDCGRLSNPKKGRVLTPSGTTYNRVAYYSCIEGYVLVGETERRCGSNGMWTPTSPFTCVPVDCGPLDNPKNGVVHTEPDTRLASTATYSCNPGYNLTGNTQRVCQSDGSWSFSAPYCADLAMLQLKFGPASYCVEWSEPRVELMYTIMRGSIFKAIAEKGGYTIPQDKINRGFFTCYNSKTRTTYRTTIAGLENVSAVDLAGLVQQWVESGATMRVLWYLIKIDESCPVLISSMDEDECE